MIHKELPHQGEVATMVLERPTQDTVNELESPELVSDGYPVFPENPSETGNPFTSEDLTSLYTDQKKYMYYVLLKRGNREEDIEDIIQETALKVFLKGKSYDASKGTKATWVSNIAANVGVDMRRKEQRRPHDSLDPVIIDSIQSPESDEISEDRVFRDAITASYQEALSALPPEQQQVMRLHFEMGLTHNEIVERTNIPLGTVKTRIKLAKSKLIQNETLCELFESLKS